MDTPEISSNLSGKLTRQSCERQKLISDVQFLEFDLHSDDGGDFHEIARLPDGLKRHLPKFEVRQINRSRFNPGLVKAFHIHKKQDEIWAVHPLDRLLVGLLDSRKGSETEGLHMRITLGGGKSRLLYIPRGIAHGGMVLGQTPVDVVYLVNQEFSSSDPDEWRLPWDTLGTDFWQIRKE
jgi:dTDP-4-dehydrorhamnose 3,5-epimerase